MKENVRNLLRKLMKLGTSILLGSLVLLSLSACQKPYTYEEALDIIKEYAYLEEVEVVDHEENDEAFIISIDDEGVIYTYEVSKKSGEIISVGYKEEKDEFSYLANGNISYDDALTQALNAYGKLASEATNFVLIDESKQERAVYNFTYEDGLYLYEVDIDPKSGEMLSMQRKQKISEVYLFEGEIGLDEALNRAKEELNIEEANEVTIMAISEETPYYEVRIDDMVIMINALSGEVLNNG